MPYQEQSTCILAQKEGQPVFYRQADYIERITVKLLHPDTPRQSFFSQHVASKGQDIALEECSPTNRGGGGGGGGGRFLCSDR